MAINDIFSYDSFAKLNIMTEAREEGTPAIPQIMFDLSKSGTKHTWNGDRLAITYNSGNNASLFRISEVTGTYRNKLNFELLGSNNIFYGTVKGTSNNSFIFASNNLVANSAYDNNFINSDGNQIFPTRTSGINFIDSDYNTLASGYLYHKYSSAANISFYHSTHNRILPQFTYIKGIKGDKGGRTQEVISQALYDNRGEITGYSVVSSYNGTNTYIKGVKGGILRNKTLIDSDYNRFIGHDDVSNNTVLINSNNGYYLNNLSSKNSVIIGNDWGYIKGVSANTVAIGRGLINYNTTADKLILGQFNRNSNASDVLVVGDGHLTDEYLNSLTAANKNWQTNDTQYRNILSALSGNGSPSGDNGLYRHNIFTVNRNGYITISNWNNPSNSARYGVKGITAYNDGAVYTIPYKTLYNKINVGDAITQMQETVDSYTKQIDDIIKTMPSNYFYSVQAGIKQIYLTEDNRQPGTVPSNVKYIWSAISAKMDNNTILGITYEGNPSDELEVYWGTKKKSSNNFVLLEPSALSATIKPYCAKQFLFVIPSKNADADNVSGFIKIDD